MIDKISIILQVKTSQFDTCKRSKIQLRGEPGLEGEKYQFFKSHLIRLEIYSDTCLQHTNVWSRNSRLAFGVGEFEIYTGWAI